MDCQQAPPIRGARGREGWRRSKGLVPSCLPVCISPALLHPSSGEPFNSSWTQYAMFQHLQNQSPSCRHTSHHLKPLLGGLDPSPWGHFSRDSSTESNTCSLKVWVSTIIPRIFFVPQPYRWRAPSCKCCLWYLRIFFTHIYFKPIQQFFVFDYVTYVT